MRAVSGVWGIAGSLGSLHSTHHAKFSPPEIASQTHTKRTSFPRGWLYTQVITRFTARPVFKTRSISCEYEACPVIARCPAV